MDEEKSCLEILKENYVKIAEKYDLPDFDILNKEFQIEKVAESETDFLIREIRKFVAEKLSNYLRFVEAILHPVNSPMFVFSIIKFLTVEDKNNLLEVYKKLAKNEVEIIELDVDFSEEKEAEFIRESYKIWEDIKKDILKFVGTVKTNWDKKFEVNGNGKDYFG